MQDAAPTYAPLPTFTGATSVESLPMNTPSSIMVVCLLHSVVVAGDGAGANVYSLADLRVAKVGQVIGLGSFAQA